MLAILSIIIGIVFVLLLFSMLTSAMVEVYHAAFSSRGKHLRETIEIMLGKEVSDKFYEHSYFRQLSSATKPKSGLKLPVWVDKNTFANVLADILTPHNSNLSIPERINLVENDNLRKVLDFLWRQSYNDPKLFQKKVEEWFDNVMERAKDWFGDATKWRLFYIGLALAAILNADTLQIYKSLSTNAAVRDELVEDAQVFNDNNKFVSATDTSKTFEQAKQDFETRKQAYMDVVKLPLGIGWTSSAPIPVDYLGWFIKVLGWALTGVAVTLGAPFWFDMLRKLLAIKNGTSGAGGGNSTSNESIPAEKLAPAFQLKSAGSDPKDAPVG